MFGFTELIIPRLSLYVFYIDNKFVIDHPHEFSIYGISIWFSIVNGGYNPRTHHQPAGVLNTTQIDCYARNCGFWSDQFLKIWWYIFCLHYIYVCVYDIYILYNDGTYFVYIIYMCVYDIYIYYIYTLYIHI